MIKHSFLFFASIVGLVSCDASRDICDNVINIFNKSNKSAIDIPVIPYQNNEKLEKWICPTCSPEEQFVLKEVQKKTKIIDKNALATILGNIKQESNVISNICEGGARISYNRCHRGGYGIIQWTSESRYVGLGQFANKWKCDPSELICQTRYMVNEPVFVKTLPTFQGNGRSVHYYMGAAYRWLGWGVEGYRYRYSYDYTKKLQLS